MATLLEAMLAEAQRVYRYKDGNLYWRVQRGNRGIVGKRAGTARANGYRSVVVLGKSLEEHRVVFALHRGHWPSGDVDHINGDPSDNRIENLREATRSQNSANRRPSKAKRRGIYLVDWRYRAQIQHQRRAMYLGTYETEAEAASVLNAKGRELFGEFWSGA